MPDALMARSLDHIGDIDAHTWDALNRQAGGSVLTSHAFLAAFEQSNSVCPRTGWQPQHLLIEQAQAQGTSVLGAIPLYVKGHSYGEFVFDWAWADAYERNGLSYYPKWLSGVPFTPVTSARLLCAAEHKRELAHALLQVVRANELSSLHVLYTDTLEQDLLVQAGCLARSHTQFHWLNKGWLSFDDFLSDLAQPKRKKIRAERRKAAQAGVTTITKTGGEIKEADWDFFYRCYSNTYAERGNPPYLSREFFSLIAPESCLLVLAYQDNTPIAAGLLWLDSVTMEVGKPPSRRLYGRYWGSVSHVDCLHFEVSYYTPIEWAIQNEIDVIEGGAQGEHKMARGFTPVTTRSAHWLAHQGFTQAVAEFLERERQGLAAYNETLRSPFKS
jgi:uncharacterized protein